ncbi:hypothetical protein P389DRAFT_63598 [Cystobasidium minutum MCA 4210]|uniref:uncharacterized protein n=1 Tax=Cystobasidium minutum MCA 4210 TaxID=1397322 RepID=UPI0034CF97A8|eukprot:jgi/Rhomi1/63598/CE63597_1603
MAGRPPPPRFVQLRTATRGEPDRSDGSRTITVEHDNDEAEASNAPDFDGVLRLRGGPTHGNRVTWQEGTVDNEFLNRKKSKICCIFHKAKPKNFEDPFADSSSSSSSSDDDSSDESSESECSSCNGENSRNRQTTTSARDGQPFSVKGKERAIDTDNNEEADGLDNNEHSADCPHSTHNHGHKHKSRRLKPNAYEHQPKYGKAKKKRDKGSSTVTITEPPAPGQAEL